MLHGIPTSNCCERLFSRAKIFSSDRRKCTSPYHLELSIVLWANRHMWDAATIYEYMKLRREDEDPEDRLVDDGDEVDDEVWKT